MGFLDFFTGDQPPLIKGALRDVGIMLDTGRDMFAAASARLLDNEILDVDLRALHSKITMREHAARRAVLEHLNLDPKRELVLCLKLITVVHEAGKIGECGSMMGRAARLALKPRFGSMVDSLREIRAHTQRLFDQARDAFLDGDQTKARALLARQLSVKSTLAGCIHELASINVSPNQAMVFTMAACALEGTGVHLANIASIVTRPFVQP